VNTPPALVVGLDLSLQSAGVVVLNPGWAPQDPWKGLAHATYGGKAVPGEAPILRIKRLANELAAFVQASVAHAPAGTPLHVYVEQYAFAQARLGNSASLTALAELGGVVKLAILDAFGVVTQPVTSGQWRKLLLGFGAKKNIKEIAQAELRLAGAPFKSGDSCDAFGVSNWGRSELGLPALTLATCQNPSARASSGHGKVSTTRAV